MGLLHNGLDHLAVVVRDTEEALTLWRDKIGLKVLFSEKVNEDSVLLTHLDLGSAHLQLVEPLVHSHPLWNWLDDRAKTGLHHLCFSVNDIELAFRNLQQQTGLKPAQSLHQGTKGKRAFFVEPSSTLGLIIEITGY